MNTSREHEVYALKCWQCAAEIEIRCDLPHHCPHCGEKLTLEWERAGGEIRGFCATTGDREGE